MQASVLGYLQGPQDAAVTLETAPVLEVPTVRPQTPMSLHPTVICSSGCSTFCKFYIVELKS